MGDWYNAKLTIHPEGHPGVRVHQHELDHLRRERLIRSGGDGSELVTEIADSEPTETGQQDGSAVPGAPAPLAAAAQTPLDGTASKTGPKTTIKE